MALRGASTTVDQDWLDFKELAAANTAAVFTVTGFGEKRDFGNGEITPVIADVVILTGPRAGEQHIGERVLAAGIRSKLTEVGESVVGRLRPYGQRKHPGLEAEEAGDMELAEKALAKFGGGDTSSKPAAKDADSEEPPF